MAIIADLLVKVGSDIGSFKTGMADVGKGVGEAEGHMGKLGAIAGPVGLAIAGTATALTAFAIHAVDSAAAAGQAAFEMGEKFGLSGQQASQFISVGAQLGISSEQIAKGFQFLSKNTTAMQLTLDAGGKLSKVTGEVYKELGINVLDSGGKVKSAQELMLLSADAFSRLPDGPNKAALAMKLFGKSGTDMLPVLNQGRAGIQALMESGRQQGQVMTNEQVAAAHKLHLEQLRLNQTLGGVTTQIGLFLMPIMLGLTTLITQQVAPAIQRMGNYFTQHIMPAVRQIAAAFMQLLSPALTYIRANIGQLQPILQGLGIAFLIVGGIVVVAVGLIIAIIVGVVFSITWLVTNARRYLPEFAATVGRGVGSAIAWLNSVDAWIKAAPGRLFAGALAIGTNIWKGIVAGIQGAGSAIMNAIKAILPGGANGPLVAALHAQGVPGFQFGGVVQGPYLGAPVLIQAHAGERYLGAPGSTQAASGGGGDISVINHFHQVMGDPGETAFEVGWSVFKLRRKR